MDRIINQLLSSNHVLLASHTNPDGDAVGSTIAMGLLLAAIDKKISDQTDNNHSSTVSSVTCNSIVTIVSRKILEYEIIKDINEYIQSNDIHELIVAEFSTSLLTAFFNEIENNDEGVFLLYFDKCIRTLINRDIDVFLLQDIITLFRRKLDKN